MNAARMVALVDELGAVKSRQDVEAAIALQHADMRLAVPPLDAVVLGRDANRRALGSFFETFPDYQVTLEGRAATADELIAWGTVRMTLSTDRFGVVPNGRLAVIPAFFRFSFAEDLISSEYFLWDLADACGQWGVSTDAVRARLLTVTRGPAAR